MGEVVIDEERLRDLHSEHGTVLRLYATRLTNGDSGRAEDAVQETFVRLWNRPEVLDDSRGSLRGWLLTTVRNIVIDEFRYRQRRPELLPGELPDEASPLNEIDRMLSATLLTDALRSLAEPHREALVHCYYGGLTVTELAARLALPVGTIKSRLFYGLRALRAALGERGVQA